MRRGVTVFWIAEEAGKEGGREKEREGEGKHYSSVPSKHKMLGYFNKKEPFIWERETKGP